MKVVKIVVLIIVVWNVFTVASALVLDKIDPYYAVLQKEHELTEDELIAVCPGEGIAETFLSLGTDGCVSGGQTMNPSTEDILSAIDSVNAETVFVLPNNKNIVMAARQAAELTERRVIVIPTRSIPEGIAAMQGYNTDLDADSIERAMNEFASTADTAQVTYAARDSEFDGMHITEGDYLALYGGKLAGNGRSLRELLSSLATRASENGKELITVYYGSDVTEDDARSAASVFEETFGSDNVILINGGQPVYYYIISAE